MLVMESSLRVNRNAMRQTEGGKEGMAEFVFPEDGISRAQNSLFMDIPMPNRFSVSLQPTNMQSVVDLAQSSNPKISVRFLKSKDRLQ